MKLIFQDKMTCIVLSLSLLIFLLIINSLSLGAHDRSSVPIGLLVMDHSESAEQLTERIKQVPALYVQQGDEASLHKLLKEEQISAIFVIEEGYEKSIKAGRTKNLITMYYMEGNGATKIISDIFAGEMLYKINLYKGFNLYRSLPEDIGTQITPNLENSQSAIHRFSEQEYMKYAQVLTESEDFDFAFDIAMVNVEKNEEIGKILNNSIIYQQIIWGILGMLLSFVAMFIAAGIVLDKEMGLEKRIRISLLRTSLMDYSHLGAILTVLSIFSLLLCILIGGKVQNFTLLKGCALYLLMLLFSLVMGLWFILLGKVIRKVGKYEYIGAFSSLLFGFLGFFYIIEGLMNSKMLKFSKLIPNVWFIKGFTDIILNGSLQDIPFTAHEKLAITAICLFIINRLIGRRQNR